MRSIFKDKELQKIFDKQGYVHTNLLNKVEVSELILLVNQLKPEDKFAPNIDIYHASDFHCTFLDNDVDYKRSMNKLIKEKFTSKINQVLVDYRIINGNFYVKPAHKGFFALHQNWRHTLNDDVTSVTVWCPLQDTTKENGTLHVVPASNKITNDISLPNQTPFYRSFEKGLWEKYVKEVPVKAGDCLIFCDTLLHGSPTNFSDAVRMAFQIETLPKEEPAVIYHYNELNPDVLEIYEANDEFFLCNNLVNVPFIGTIPNPNKNITLQEFEALLHAGKIAKGY
jgi:hypothetical protein